MEDLCVAAGSITKNIFKIMALNVLDYILLKIALAKKNSFLVSVFWGKKELR